MLESKEVDGVEMGLFGEETEEEVEEVKFPSLLSFEVDPVLRNKGIISFSLLAGYP